MYKRQVYADTVPESAEEEKKRLEAAVKVFCDKNEAMAKQMDALGSDGEILRGHIAMLSDPYMISQINDLIDKGSCAEKAVETVCNIFISIFSATDDELTKQRAADVEDIKKQLQKILLGLSLIHI